MNIIISDKVKESLKYLRKDSITIFLEESLGCWGQTFTILVRINPPKGGKTEGYEKLLVDGINVYLSDEVSAYESLSLEVCEVSSDMPDREIIVTPKKLK